jgi:Zn-dependent protease
MSQHVVEGMRDGVGYILLIAAITNYVLFFFNLLPVPPLDGGHVAQSFLPYRYRNRYAEVARYAPFVLLPLLIAVPQVRVVFVWPATQVGEFVYHGFGHLFGPA